MLKVLGLVGWFQDYTTPLFSFTALIRGIQGKTLGASPTAEPGRGEKKPHRQDGAFG
jgi:hypothetical protein